MAVLNKPENRKTNEAHDLGQISTKEARAHEAAMGNATVLICEWRI